MADAPKILGTDTLKKAYPKLNQAIELVNDFQHQIDTIVIEGDSSVESAQARVAASGQTFTTLKERLDSSDFELSIRATKSDVANMGSATPKGGFTTLAALQTAYPTGTTGIYVVQEDGKWYYWSGSAWVAGGPYQGTVTLGTLNVDYIVTIKSSELMKNPGFETWAGSYPDNWGYQTGVGTITIETTSPHSGTNAIKLTHGNVVDQYNTQIYQDITVEPGKTYDFSFWTKGDGTYDGSYGIYRNTAPSVYLLSIRNTGVKGSEWTKVTHSITIPDGCTSIKLWFFAPNTNGAAFYLDDISFVKSETKNRNGEPLPLQTLLDNFPALAIKFDNVLSGLGAKTVQEAINELALNGPTSMDSEKIFGALNVDYVPLAYGPELTKNNGFETWTETAATNWTMSGGDGGLFAKDTTNPHSGSNSVKLTQGINKPWYNVQIDQDITVEPGTTYELGFWTKGDGTNAGVYALYDNTNGRYIFLNGPTGVTANEWTKVTRQFVAPAFCTSVKVWFFAPAPSSSFANFDDISLKKVMNSNMNGQDATLQFILDNFPAKAVKYDNQTSGLLSKNIQDAIGELLDVINGTNAVKLSLPDKYELVVGDTFELFYKGILYANNPYIYNFKISCSKGAVYSKRFIYTPAAGDVGTWPLTISIYDDSKKLLDTKTVQLIVKNKAANPSTMQYDLCVGDSLTGPGVWPSEVFRRLTGTGGTPAGDGLSNIKFIGSCKGTNGAFFEGYGGWTYDSYNSNNLPPNYWVTVTSGMKVDQISPQSIWQDANGKQWQLETLDTTNGKIKFKQYPAGSNNVMPSSGTLQFVSGSGDQTAITFSESVTEAANPFWINGKVDFAAYALKLGVSRIDHIYVLLGWNSTGSTETKFKNDVRTFINNVRTSFPNCKITLLGLQVPSLDGYGANYGAAWNYMDHLQIVFNFNKWNYEVAKEFTNVDFINIAGQFDSENNIITATRTVNVRSNKTEVYGANGVHPAYEGYLQIADAVYRHLTHKL